MLRAEVTYDDGTEPSKRFKVAATHKLGTVLPEQVVSAENMMTMKWLIQRCGKKGSAVPKQSVLAKISHAIMNTSGDVPSETIYAQTGWKVIDGEYVFLMPSENNPYTVDLKGKLDRNRFDKHVDKSDVFYVYAMMEQSFAPQRVLLPLLSVSFLSPLNHFLKKAGCEPKFVTALIGKTGCRKSTVAALFLSFFGNFTASDLPMSFHDTANSVLENVYYLKDVLTCIDDYHPGGVFQEKEMKSIAQNISRYYGDRIGRARLNCKAELQRSKPPTGNAIITAEFAPSFSVSGCARYFIIELNENDIDLDVLTEFQQKAEEGVLSGIMMLYTDWLKKNYLKSEKDFVKVLASGFRSYRSGYTRLLTAKGIKFHSRTPDMLAHLKLGFVFLREFVKDCGMLRQGEYERFEKEFDEMLIESCGRNAEQLTDEEPVVRFSEKLCCLIESGTCYVESRNSGAAPQKGYLGMEDEKNYYLLADVAHREVTRFCTDQKEHFSISKKELLKQLAQDGILVQSGGRNTTTVRAGNGKNISVAVLDKAAMAQRMSRDLCRPVLPTEQLPDQQAQSAAQGNVAQV